MKKLLPLLALLFCITNAYSQNLISKASPNKKFLGNHSQIKASKQPSGYKKTTTSNTAWFNYGTAAEVLFGNTGYLTSSYLFPDSLGYGEYGAGNFSGIWIHHIAEVADFKSPIYSINPSTNWVTTNTVFDIDSMSIYYAYTRNHPNPNIVDTLVISLFDNTNSNNLATNLFLNSSGFPGGSDTLSFIMLGYNQNANVIASATNTANIPSGQYKFKIPLTIVDTAATAYREKFFALPVPFSSQGGKIVVADIQFIPGYTYTLSQQIDATANAFFFTSLEENGSNSLLNFFDCNYGSSQCDYSSSQIVPLQVRYNTIGPSWNGHFIPAIAYTVPYAFEHHLISFHLTDTTASPCQVNSTFSIIADTLNPGVYNAYETSTGNGVLSYQWDFGDGTSSTLQYPNHQYAIPGQYIVCLTVTSAIGTNTCSDTYCDSSSVQKMAAGFLMSQFNVIAPIVTNINETEKSIEIKAYPNPISDELVIEFTHKDFERLNYELIDAIGRVVLSNSFEKGKTTINTSQLSKGFYNLNIINADGNKIKSLKIIK